MEELLDRCQLLLKPIRDLEQNWSVDIANELTQALISLNEQMVSFGQHGDKIIDFSKAALIIQGSAHVYSKKVDYLYKSVYEMKEWMEKLWEVEKKSRSARSRANGDGTAPELDIDEDEDADLDLSALKEEDTCIDETRIVDHLDGVVLLAPKPSHLTGLFNLKIAMKSMSGDVIGYMNEFLINSIDAEALLQDVATANHNVISQAADVAELIEQEPAPVDMPEPCDVNDDSYDDGAPHCADTSQLQPAETPVRIDRHAQQLRPRIIPASPPKAPVVDPWSEILDPHSAVQRSSKIVKPGNCRLLPPALRKGKKRKPNGSRASNEKQDDIVTFCTREYNTKAPVTGGALLFPEFKVLFANILKKRLDDFKAIKRGSRMYSVEEDNLIQEDGDADDGGWDDGDDGDDNIPFSRLNAEDVAPTADSGRGDENLPLGYSDFLSEVLQREYEDLATYNDKLSDIDKRVKAWENNVREAIESAETRPAFDMLFYTSSIFDSFSGDQHTIHMDRILEGKPKYDAFRTFVSALILANHGNIEIVEDHKQVHLSLLHKTTLSDVIAAEGATE